MHWKYNLTMKLDVTKCCLYANVNFITFANFWSCRYYCNGFIRLAVFSLSLSSHNVLGYRCRWSDSESDVDFGCIFDSSSQKYNLRYISWILNPPLLTWHCLPIGCVCDPRIVISIRILNLTWFYGFLLYQLQLI